MKRYALLLLFLLTACAPAPTPTRNLPVGAEAPAADAPICEDYSLFKEDVTNIPQSYPLTIDANNNLSGLPENTGLDEDDVLPFVKAILDRQYADPLFRGVSVTFSQDPKSKRWGFFASTPNGYLHNLVSYANGPDQFADYPLDLRGGVVNGKYAEVGVPGMTQPFFCKLSHKYPSYFNKLVICQHNNVFRSATPR